MEMNLEPTRWTLFDVRRKIFPPVSLWCRDRASREERAAFPSRAPVDGREHTRGHRPNYFNEWCAADANSGDRDNACPGLIDSVHAPNCAGVLEVFLSVNSKMKICCQYQRQGFFP